MLDHHTIEKYELGWLVVALVLIAMLFAGVLASMISETVPGFFGTKAQYIDPAKLSQTPFATPGLKTGPDGALDAYIVATAFQFQPNVLRVPAGRPVTLHMVSTDVIHGLLLGQGNVNVELIPGQVAVITKVFDHPGSYTSECNEYCGTGHQTMSFKLIVEAAK
ncbi:cytochrome C oxidase subunit II [Deinococcus ruber]|uniref:Cytochrome c oxidase subunit 2 n=1 Tax=Deinococcus ruber TaxID=1848197 RepID=A0A918C3J5_9DEIO|nr:cytochrome C oxidase subunit II [Deinococcus ruber]GGR03260.1 cytochrome c oxidase subunit 2 [Deinococcus ruber]